MTIHEFKDLADAFVAMGNDGMGVKLVLCQAHINL